MEKNWLIRTAKKQIIGPVKHDRLRDLIQKGSLKEEDEICQGNGFWFQLKEQDLLQRYLLNNERQHFNPITEAQDVLTAPMKVDLELPSEIVQKNLPDTDFSWDEPGAGTADDQLELPVLTSEEKSADKLPTANQLPAPQNFDDITMVGKLNLGQVQAKLKEANGYAGPRITIHQQSEDNAEAVAPNAEDLEYPDELPQKILRPVENVNNEAREEDEEDDDSEEEDDEEVEEGEDEDSGSDSDLSGPQDQSVDESSAGGILYPKSQDLEYPDIETIKQKFDSKKIGDKWKFKVNDQEKKIQVNSKNIGKPHPSSTEQLMEQVEDEELAEQNYAPESDEEEDIREEMDRKSSESTDHKLKQMLVKSGIREEVKLSPSKRENQSLSTDFTISALKRRKANALRSNLTREGIKRNSGKRGSEADRRGGPGRKRKFFLPLLFIIVLAVLVFWLMSKVKIEFVGQNLLLGSALAQLDEQLVEKKKFFFLLHH